MDLMLSQEGFIMFEEIELAELSFVKDKNCIEEEQNSVVVSPNKEIEFYEKVDHKNCYITETAYFYLQLFYFVISVSRFNFHFFPV